MRSRGRETVKGQRCDQLKRTTGVERETGKGKAEMGQE